MSTKKRVPKKAEEKKESTELSLWSPQDYAHEIDRIFSDFTRRLDRSLVYPFDTSLFPRFPFEIAESRRPSADIIDAGNEYRVRVEVPGIPKEKLNISVTPREIHVEGEAETKIDEDKEGYVHRERMYSKIRRNLTFPEEVIADKADAVVRHGVLEVTVPKKAPTESKTHRVQVREEE